MNHLQIITASHPDRSKVKVEEVPYRRQRLSTLYRRYAPSGADIAILRNGVDLGDRDLRKVRARPGDRILFAPRVGLFAAIAAIAAWAWPKVVTIGWNIGLAQGISYLGGELFGQDLPDSDSSASGQSFGWNPRTAQVEGSPISQAFGTNSHHGTLIAKWTEVAAAGETSEILYMLVCFGEGPTEGVLDSQIFLNDRPITDYSGVTWDERKGTLNQTAITGFTATKIEKRVEQVVTESGGPVTVTLPRAGFDDIHYTICFDQGLYMIRKSGDFVGRSVSVKVEIAVAGTESWTTLFNSTMSDAGQRAPKYLEYGAAAQGFSCDRTKKYKLKVTRISSDNATGVCDRFQLKSIRGVIDIAFRHPGKSLIGIKALATAGLSGDIDLRCIRQDKICLVYNGAAWVLEYSHNRAWVVYNMLTQPAITGDGGGTAYAVDSYEGFDPAQLDTAFFYEWSQLVDDLVDDGNSGTEELLPCHHIFDSKVELWKSAYEVAQIGRAHLVWQGNKISGWIDKAWTGASDLITDENIVPGSWKQQWTNQAELAGTMIVNFQDSAQGYKRIPLPVHNADAGRSRNIISVEAIGLKTIGQATRVGRFGLARNALIREVDSLRMHKDAMRYKCGDVHPIQRKKANWGTSYRVRRYVNSTTLLLDRTVVATAGDDLYVRSYNPSTEEVVTIKYAVKGIAGSRVTITTSFTVQPISNDIVAIGSTSQIKLRRIKAIEWTGDHFFELTVETYDADLFTYDAAAPVIPYTDITPPESRNKLERFVTMEQVQQLIEQQMPLAVDTDTPVISNCTWTDNQDAAGKVQWSATDADENIQIRYRGTTYAITAGSDADRFIYWITGESVFRHTNSESTMATALLSRAWVVCENRSGTGWPVTPFQLVWAGLLQAGTITAALGIIADACIETAKIKDLNVTSAKIAHLNVTTLKIANNAVTIPVSAFSAAKLDLGSAATTVQSAAITATGSPISISFSAEVINPEVDDDQYAIKVYRGGTAIYTGAIYYIMVAGATKIHTISLTDTPCAGSYSF